MATSTDAAFQRLTTELVMPGKGFWSLSQFAGATVTGQLYFQGEVYEKVSILAPQGDGHTYFAGISGRTLNRALQDACELLDDVAAEVAAISEAESSAAVEGDGA